MAELRQLITEVASNVVGQGLIGVVISDKDGVPVMKVALDSGSQLIEGCFRHQFLSVCSTLSEHANKMCLGPSVSINASFDDYQVVHCYHASLILTMVATHQVLTGQLVNLSKTLQPLMVDMSKQLLPLA